MARGIFFCESIWGLGHVKRLASIASAAGDADFFHAGPSLIAEAPGVRFHTLPPLFRYEGLAEANLPSKSEINALVEKRFAKFREAVSGVYDYYVIEMFPFAKELLFFDFERHILYLKAKNPRLKVYCSFRGYHNVKPAENKFLEMLHEFDGVLVHTDPSLLRLETSYPDVDFSRANIAYTGFVTEPYIGTKERGNTLIISFGGGHQAKIALELLDVLKRYRRFDIRIALGPYCPPEIKENVLASGIGEVSDFIPDFRAALASARLSLSLGGYNTLMDLLQTKTPSLVIRGASDQKILPKVLANKGLLVEIDSKELEKEHLERKIEEALRWRCPDPYPPIDFGGKAASATLLTSGF
ncbi:MAG: hypothetical protein KDK48_04255 [Chlamydiia bacterium]|nr:hypothetical protein [Chlamydiia bacterium]